MCLKSLKSVIWNNKNLILLFAADACNTDYFNFKVRKNAKSLGGGLS